jgi:hypothetical protein
VYAQAKLMMDYLAAIEEPATLPPAAAAAAAPTTASQSQSQSQPGAL